MSCGNDKILNEQLYLLDFLSRLNPTATFFFDFCSFRLLTNSYHVVLCTLPRLRNSLANCGVHYYRELLPCRSLSYHDRPFASHLWNDAFGATFALDFFDRYMNHDFFFFFFFLIVYLYISSKKLYGCCFSSCLFHFFCRERERINKIFFVLYMFVCVVFCDIC